MVSAEQRWKFAAQVIILAILAAAPVLSQLSDPIAHDSNLKDRDTNKFLQRNAYRQADVLDEEPVVANTQCAKNVELRWMTEISSSIYSTPLIADINSDGKQEVVVPSFVHYLEVLEGADGEKAPGWPAYHTSSVHSSPFLHDIDGDGKREIGVATYNGEILFFRPTGELLDSKLVVPRLRIRKDWYVGLDPDHVDHSKPDVGQGEPQAGAAGREGMGKEAGEEIGGGEGKAEDGGGTGGGGGQQQQPEGQQQQSDGQGQGQAQAEQKVEEGKEAPPGEQHQTVTPTPLANCEGDQCTAQGHVVGAGHDNGTGNERTHSAMVGGGNESVEGEGVVESGVVADAAGVAGHGVGDVGVAQQRRRRLLEVQKVEGGEGVEQVMGQGGKGGGAGAGAQGREIIQEEEAKMEGRGDGGGAGGEAAASEAHAGAADQNEAPPGAENAGQLASQAADSFVVFDAQSDDQAGAGTEQEAGQQEQPQQPNFPLYDYDDYDYAHMDSMWRDEGWHEYQRQQEANFVYVDAHILCSPTVADINNDGIDELVVAASYFFDREYYDNQAHAGELPEGIDITKYIAGGIVVFDLKSLIKLWNVHLDLTTETTQFRAYIYSPPTVVDLDADGFLEILVGTSVGFVYCLNHWGATRPNFPIQMGEVQGQVAVADVNGDGLLEICSVDTRGNVAVFSWNGQELWERHVASLIAQGVSVGDVNGDGVMEVVFGTASGFVYALRGTDGADVGSFPFRTHGRIMAPVLLTNLKPNRPRGTGLDVVVTSFDGYLYVIEGDTGCADAVDVGETSYSMVLADNVDGGEDLDLIVSTMNGNVYCFQTPVRFHPSFAWRSQGQGRNGFSSLLPRGLFVLPGSRKFRDMGGYQWPIQFEIVDSGQASTNYSVEVAIFWPLGVSGRNVYKESKSFRSPGVYTMVLPVPPRRLFATVVVSMEDRHGLYYSDEFAVSFNMYFYRLLKWVLVLPLVFMASPILLFPRDQQQAPLPTVSMHEL